MRGFGCRAECERLRADSAEMRIIREERAKASTWNCGSLLPWAVQGVIVRGMRRYLFFKRLKVQLALKARQMNDPAARSRTAVLRELLHKVSAKERRVCNSCCNQEAEYLESLKALQCVLDLVKGSGDVMLREPYAGELAKEAVIEYRAGLEPAYEAHVELFETLKSSIYTDAGSSPPRL